jgi:hypothetical protein
MGDHSNNRMAGANLPLMATINRAALHAFGIITLIWVVFAALPGTWIMWRPMTNSESMPEVVVVWIIFIVGASIRLLAQPFAAYALGFGEVAAVRRSEAASWLLGGFGVIVILIVKSDLILAMIAMQAPTVLNFVQYRRLAYRLGWSAASKDESGVVQRELWLRAWRGGIAAQAGVLTIFGSGFIFAQVGASEVAAAYLLGLNILGIAGQVAFSPLFAAAPDLAARFSRGELASMNKLAQRAISRSMRAFALLVAIVPIASIGVNALIPEPIALPDAGLWLAMCATAMMLRHSSDHLFYYTTTNDIRGHIINPIFLILSLGPFLFLPASNVFLLVGIQGLAAALIHFPYSRRLTYHAFGYGLRCEIRDFVVPFVAMFFFLAILSLVSA